MRLLLDTQVVLWWFDDTSGVPQVVGEAIEDPTSEIVLSAIVIWEIAIKARLGKLGADDHFRERVAAYDFVPLPVTAQHAWVVRHLPLHHGDPFDRLLVAQAQIEGATLVTADERLRAYDVPILWS